MGRGANDDKAGMWVADRATPGARSYSYVPVKTVDAVDAAPVDKKHPSVSEAEILVYSMARKTAETDQARIAEREEILEAGVPVSNDPWLTNRLLAVAEDDQEQLDNIGKIRSSSEPVVVTNVLGEESHWLNGKLHREDGPAITYKSISLARRTEAERRALEMLTGEKSGARGWVLANGIHPTSGQAWYRDGKPYRENGEPAVIYMNGLREQMEFREYWQGDDLGGASFRRDTYDHIPYADKKDRSKYKASEWLKRGPDGELQLYRENGPTQVMADGTEIWSVQAGDQSVYHREDGPAYISKDEVSWHRKGELHREDGPAKIFSNGRQEWYIDNQLHRENGPAVEDAAASEYWQRGKLHREDGPAIVRSDNTKEWYIEGELHREDGPAVEDAEGWGQWYDHGHPISAKRSRFSTDGEPAWWEQVEAGSKIDD